MGLANFKLRSLSWRWSAAGLIYLCGFVGLLSGVELSERTAVVDGHWLTKAYYSLGIFVVGGLDLGVPVGGPVLGRALVWLAYFAAPVLMASAVVDAMFRVFAPQRWQLRRLNDHYVVNGTGRLTMSYLQLLRKQHPRATVVVVEQNISPAKQRELTQAFDVRVVSGDLTSPFFIRQLRVKRARRIALLAVDDYRCYEAASRLLQLYPDLGDRILLHCSNLRFMRAMEETSIARRCTTFNSYQLASDTLVREQLLKHFQRTRHLDVVVLGGFGRLGQTLLEELSNKAESELSAVALIDTDADRRVLVADEQQRSRATQRRIVLQGDVGHPNVWQRLSEEIDLAAGEPVLVMGTGGASNNMRTGLWLKKQYPNALVYVRTEYDSLFAREVAGDHDIKPFSIIEAVELGMPPAWLD